MNKQRLDEELKAAMLSGDKERATLIRGLKSAVLYEEVQLQIKDQGLSDEQVEAVLRREAKKRRESAELYKSGGDEQRAQRELDELAYIESLLPKAMSEADVTELVGQVVAELKPEGMKDMGRVISEVRARSGGRADGALVARLVKEAL